MNEFFGPATTNVRKRDIETILSNFGQQRGAWKQCLYYVAHTRNSYVSMYCLTTLEVSVIIEFDRTVPLVDVQFFLCMSVYVRTRNSYMNEVVYIMKIFYCRCSMMRYNYIVPCQFHLRTSSTSNG